MPEYASPAEFGAILKQLRLDERLSQADVAERLKKYGVKATGSAVGGWERGDSYPQREKVFALEKVFNVLPGWLSQHLGYFPPGTTGYTEEVELSASGRDLEELRQADPESYEQIMSLARLALDRARERRRR